MDMTNVRQKRGNNPNGKTNGFLMLILVLFLALNRLQAGSAGTSGGLTLLEAPGARPAALGEAYTAMGDDIQAFGYNPASLASLKTGQGSFLYQKGLLEDSYGHFMMGIPSKKGALGFSVGYYNGGSIEIIDGTSARTVTAQSDLVASLGVATNRGNLSLGMTGTYISSKLVETAQAHAYAVDLGLGLSLSPRVQMGAALKNFGTQLKYAEEGDNLPRMARVGFAFDMLPKLNALKLLVDAPYFLNEQELRPALGLETFIGPLALRAGVKGGKTKEYTVGTGFVMGRSSLDYSFGMMDQLNSQQKISFSMRFAGPSASVSFVKKQDQPKTTVVQKSTPIKTSTAGRVPLVPPAGEFKTASVPARRIYVVKPGDSLGKIAKEFYGKKENAKLIHNANRHLINNPDNLEVGQKIILP